MLDAVHSGDAVTDQPTIGYPARAYSAWLHGLHVAVELSRRPAILWHRHEPPSPHGHGRRTRRHPGTSPPDDELLHARFRRRAALLWARFRPVWPKAYCSVRLHALHHRRD